MSGPRLSPISRSVPMQRITGAEDGVRETLFLQLVFQSSCFSSPGQSGRDDKQISGWVAGGVGGNIFFHTCEDRHFNSLSENRFLITVQRFKIRDHSFSIKVYPQLEKIFIILSSSVTKKNPVVSVIFYRKPRDERIV